MKYDSRHKNKTLLQRVTALLDDKITEEMCFPNDYNQSIFNKVVAVKASVLGPAGQIAACQLIWIMGGKGAYPNADGRDICKNINLSTGKYGGWLRKEIQGEVKPEYLPEWAKERLAIVKQEHAARRALAEAKKHKKARGTECER